MVTFYKRTRRYHGDSGMQMLGGLFLTVCGIGMALLVGLAVADFMTGFNTIHDLAVRVMR